MTPEECTQLVLQLTFMPKETEWAEFKKDNFEHQEIGEYISALSNASALHRQAWGYILWGIENQTHAIVGTTFKPRQKKVGEQKLENWLATQLEPRIDFQIFECTVEDKPVVLFRIQPATYVPVRFRGVEYIRVGTYKKKLSDHPEKERALWALFSESSFEGGVAVSNIDSDGVLDLIDYPSYFQLTKQPLPDNRTAILSRLASDKLISERSRNRFDVTNLGAILFANKLSSFERLSRKGLRVIVYKGANRVEAIREQIGEKGYAGGFQGAVSWITDRLPQNEEIKKALRTEVKIYPEIAIRELVANALIHQDFNITGAGPMIEIFEDRMEVSNPGAPLVDTLRFIDEPPRSRNETLAALMRRIGICEERGSGIDKVIAAIEVFQLPAPDFRVAGTSTVAVLYAPRDIGRMDKSERIRACYQHACLLYVSGKRMTNSTLRKRLGIKDSNYPLASRIINDTIETNLVRQPTGGSGSKRDASYVPFWA